MLALTHAQPLRIARGALLRLSGAWPALAALTLVWLMHAAPVQAQSVAPGQDQPSDLVAGLRFQNFLPSADEEIYLGVVSLSEPANRNAQQYDWQATQPFSLRYDGATTLTAQVGANEPFSYNLDAPLTRTNYLEISIAADALTQPQLETVALDGNSLGNLDGAADATTFWHVSDYDLSGSWEITGSITLPAPTALNRTASVNGGSVPQVEILIGGIGRIVVEKATNPPDAPGDFTFDGDVSGTTGAGGQLSAQVASGIYTASETSLPNGFVLDDIQCNDGDSSGDLTKAQTTFVVAVGETVTCVFTNELPGVIIEESDGVSAVTEGAAAGPGLQAGYEVRLRSMPGAPVNIAILPDSQVRVNKTVLSFTPEKWATPQQVLITATDDDFDELTPHPGLVDHRVSSVDPLYDDIDTGYQTPFINPSRVDATPRTVEVAVTDDDTAAIVIEESSSGTPLLEGSSQLRFYTLSLTSRPRADVTLTLSADSQLTVDPTSVVIPAAEWSLPVTIMGMVVDDEIVEGPHSGDITHSAVSSDPQYGPAAIYQNTSQTPSPQPNILRINIEDDDIPGLILAPARINILEGGSDSYTVALAARPTQPVEVTLTSDSQTSTDADSLTFLPGDWMTPQAVLVTAVDDDDTEGPHLSRIRHTATSTDPNYQALGTATLTVDIADDDSPSVFVAPSVLELEEGGPGDAYDIVLTTRPADDIVIEFAVDAQVSLAAETLRFTPDNWDQPQSVSVTAVDDMIDESSAAATHTSYISHGVASDDIQYNSLPANGITINIGDNDDAAVIVTNRELAISEDGDEAGYLLRLATEPVALVTLTTRSDAEQIALNPSVVRFDANNWDEPQLIIASAVDDAIDEGDHFAIILHEASSSDARYNAVPVEAVAAAIEDDDSAGITVTPTEVLVSESGITDQYTLVLNSAPVAPVTVELMADNQVQADAVALSFDSDSWNEPQIVTVSAVNDGINETEPGQLHTGVIRHATISEDEDYADRTVDSVTVSIFDNDWPSTIWLPIIDN